MKLVKVAVAIAAAISGAAAQRPSNTSICDFYTTALLMNNTAENQATLLTYLVNTAVIGNYTKPNVGIAVPGILANATVNGEKVSLLSYFNGERMTSNRGGSSGVSINFLDGGGAAPLMENKPANDTTSNQYFLLTHLYEYFGTLLGCSMQGGSGFAAYDGEPSQFNVHKFMMLDEAQVTYFIQQVGMSAASFGVSDDDVKAVGNSLTSVFGYRCSPPTTVVKSQGAQLQAICIESDCPLADNAVCAQYNETASGTTSTASGTAASATATGDASDLGASISTVVLAAVFAMFM